MFSQGFLESKRLSSSVSVSRDGRAWTGTVWKRVQSTGDVVTNVFISELRWPLFHPIACLSMSAEVSNLNVKSIVESIGYSTQAPPSAVELRFAAPRPLSPLAQNLSAADGAQVLFEHLQAVSEDLFHGEKPNVPVYVFTSMAYATASRFGAKTPVKLLAMIFGVSTNAVNRRLESGREKGLLPPGRMS